LWQISFVRHRAETSGTITDRDLMNLLVFGIAGAGITGTLTAFYKMPQYCEVKTANASQNAYFLVALQRVTALEIDGQTVILSNSQIEQITCGIPRPDKAADVAS
jgi:hypothetical protein